MKRLMTGLVLMAVFAGCASAPKLAPKAGPDEVRVFYANSGVEPEAGYQVIGPIKIQRPISAPDDRVVMDLRIEAAKMGADAIIIQQIGRRSQGAIDTGMAEDYKIGEALAIYWAATP